MTLKLFRRELLAAQQHIDLHHHAGLRFRPLKADGLKLYHAIAVDEELRRNAFDIVRLDNSRLVVNHRKGVFCEFVFVLS